MGNVTSRTIKSAGGAIVYAQTQAFDELGRLLRQIGASTQTTTYAYEKNDNLKSVTDPRSGLYAYAYDAVNRLIRETDQEGAQVTLTRDGKDDVTVYKDPLNLQTTYVRNGFSEVIRETSPDRGITDTVRDARGLVTQQTDARGVASASPATPCAASRGGDAPKRERPPGDGGLGNRLAAAVFAAQDPRPRQRPDARPHVDAGLRARPLRAEGTGRAC